jgi:alpha-tubulin suppressor-like RCC1 family protein
VAIAAGSCHTLGLQADGHVVAAGDNCHGQSVTSSWRDVVAIAAGSCHSIGVRADGLVYATGCNEYGQCNITE